MTEITINLHDQPCGNCTICIGRNIGAKHEQERIIKLLNELWEITYAKGFSYPGSNAVLDAIALIKGEK